MIDNRTELADWMQLAGVILIGIGVICSNLVNLAQDTQIKMLKAKVEALELSRKPQ